MHVQVSYTSAIDACASVGDAETAERLLGEMTQRGVRPNHRSFNAVMSAYAAAGRASEAIKVLGVSLCWGGRALFVPKWTGGDGSSVYLVCR
jgi:pentatricopeptide repeat protein